MTGGSEYQVWVAAVRQWGADPTRDLSGLPPLHADSLPPAAYARLLDHLGAAIQTMMDTFSQTFTRSLAVAGSEYEMARAMVGMRAQLARRVQFCQNPALPAEFRRILGEATSRDIVAIQAELERAISAGGSRSASDRVGTDRMLMILRDNSFTAILAPDFPLQSLFGIAAPSGRAGGPAPGPRVVTGPIATDSTARVARRVPPSQSRGGASATGGIRVGRRVMFSEADQVRGDNVQ